MSALQSSSALLCHRMLDLAQVLLWQRPDHPAVRPLRVVNPAGTAVSSLICPLRLARQAPPRSANSACITLFTCAGPLPTTTWRGCHQASSIPWFVSRRCKSDEMQYSTKCCLPIPFHSNPIQSNVGILVCIGW